MSKTDKYNLEINELYFNKQDVIEFNHFSRLLKKNMHNLCNVENSSRNTEFIRLHEYAKELMADFLSITDWSKTPRSMDKYRDYFVFYITSDHGGDTNIVSFAFCTMVGNVITLEMLCGNTNKNIRLNDKKLGRILLDALYDKFVEEEKKVLYIEPANDQLANYYRKWKQPNLDIFSKCKTGGIDPCNLAYGDVFTLSERELYWIQDFALIDNMKTKWQVTTKQLQNKTSDEIKQIFYEKDDIGIYKEVIDNIKFLTKADLLPFIRNIDISYYEAHPELLTYSYDGSMTKTSSAKSKSKTKTVTKSKSKTRSNKLSISQLIEKNLQELRTSFKLRKTKKNKNLI
jgi:hypothetical protein